MSIRIHRDPLGQLHRRELVEFLDAQCVHMPGEYVPMRDLYDRYCRWALAVGVRPMPTDCFVEAALGTKLYVSTPLYPREPVKVYNVQLLPTMTPARRPDPVRPLAVVLTALGLALAALAFVAAFSPMFARP